MVYSSNTTYNPACLHQDIQFKLLVRANMELDLTYHPKNVNIINLHLFTQNLHKNVMVKHHVHNQKSKKHVTNIF